MGLNSTKPQQPTLPMGGPQRYTTMPVYMNPRQLMPPSSPKGRVQNPQSPTMPAMPAYRPTAPSIGMMRKPDVVPVNKPMANALMNYRYTQVDPNTPNTPLQGSQNG